MYMIRFILLIYLIFSSNLSYSDDNNQLQISKPPINIEPFELITKNGEKETLLNTDKVIILNFWATWCPPVLKKFLNYKNLKRNLARALKFFLYQLISNFEESVPKFLKKNKFSDIKVFNDENLALSKKFGVKIMPTTIIINKNFEEAYRIIGYVDWQSKKYKIID